MRVSLDECVPRKLKRDLIGHDVQAVVDIGWSSKRNGELLQLMLTQKFEVLLTVDQNFEFQQNVRASGLGVVVVIVRKNRLRELRPLASAMLSAIARVRPGELIRVEGEVSPAIVVLHSAQFLFTQHLNCHDSIQLRARPVRWLR